MDKKKQLPDTPWHIGYVKRDEGDPRRHMSRCIHIDKKKNCGKIGLQGYGLRCPGSAHCKYYAESYTEAKRIAKANESAEAEQETVIERHKAALKKRIQKMLDTDDYPCKYVKLTNLRKCFVCDTYLKGNSNHKICPYCGARYIKESYSQSGEKATAFIVERIDHVRH